MKDPKTEGLSIKATEEERDAIDSAAEVAGLSRSAFLVRAATAAGAGETAKRTENRIEAIKLLGQIAELLDKARSLLCSG